MRLATPVAITLIVCGTFLVALPPLSDYLHQFSVMQILAELPEAGSRSVTLQGRMEPVYKFGCWLIGAIMIAAGGFASVQRTEADQRSSLLATPAGE